MMNFIYRHFKWLMLASGILTATMFYGIFAPQFALESMFGLAFAGPLETLVIRSWSAMIGIMGAVLIFGALNEKHRALCAVIGASSKAVFVALVFTYGGDYLHAVAPALTMDITVVVFTALYLVARYTR